MRWILIFWMLSCQIIHGQFADDFSDGDFSRNPEWIGLTSWFRIDPQRESLQLHAPAEAGTAWLFTQSESMEQAVWQFSFRMAFNPSSANYGQVYLASNSCEPASISSALYLVLGTTADNVSLWHQKGSVKTLLIKGADKRLDMSVVEADVRVTRGKGGRVVLEVNMGEGWIEEGQIEHSEGFFSEWFGLSCHYTMTRSTLFWFDNFMVSGAPYMDTIPPVLTGFEVSNRYNIHLNFSKPREQLVLSPEQFVVQPGSQRPLLVVPDDEPYSLKLFYPNSIPYGGDNNLEIKELTDVYGNQMSDTTIWYNYEPAEVVAFNMTGPYNAEVHFSAGVDKGSVTSESFHWVSDGPELHQFEWVGSDGFKLVFSERFPDGEVLEMKIRSILATNGDTIPSGPYPLYFYLTQRNDVVITELMNNPSPTVMLPDSEYLELYNRGEFPVELKDFSLSVGSRNTTLPATILFPGEYVLLVPSTRDGMWDDIPNKMVLTSWPLLPVTGGVIVLRDPYQRVITSLQYHRSMGEEGFKRDGGWSLEIIDPQNLSFGWDNWAFSNNSRGGTPGEVNSINASLPDYLPPELSDMWMSSDSCIVLGFTKPMEPDEWMGAANLFTEPVDMTIRSVVPDEVFLTTSEVCFSQVIPSGKITNIGFQRPPSDLSGNKLRPPMEIGFGVPVSVGTEDVVINELLFDPPLNGEDFVELYNRSNKIADLSQLYLSRNNDHGMPERLVPLSNEKRPFFPGDFIVITAGREWLLDYYGVPDPRKIRQIPGFPNYVNAGGTVFLTDVQGRVIDQLTYDEEMHFPLLSHTKGVSLERIDVNESAQMRSNWHSASSESGYATPGMVNSQALRNTKTGHSDFITLTPEIFIPNQSGTDDLLFIHYKFEESGTCCTITIFSRSGYPVRHLVNNQLTGTSGFFTWDGTDNQGRLCATGIYIVLARSFSLEGTVRETKKVTVLGAGQ